MPSISYTNALWFDLYLLMYTNSATNEPYKDKSLCQQPTYAPLQLAAYWITVPYPYRSDSSSG